VSGRGRDGGATNRGLRSSRILLAVLLVTGAAACSSDDDEATPAATTSPPVPDTGEPVTVGDLELTPCEDLEDIWCGTIEVPQDREDDSSDETLTVGFEWYPRADPGPAEGLLVAMEGGPGYATTASRDYYTELYAPVREHRDLVLMDLRGTGRSEPVDCPDLQAYTGVYSEDTGACGRLLGDEADDYGTVQGADDLSELLLALDAPDDVTLYGDSYGSWFSQIFALRHGDQLGSLILDGTYVVQDMDPWYPTAAEVIRDQLDGQGTLTRLTQAVRTQPLEGRADSYDGTPVDVVLGPSELGDLAASGAFNRAIYRDLDAAGSAWLDDGDPLPLLRLAAENYDPGTEYPLVESSEGEYASVTCNDYDQLYDMASPPAERHEQFERAVEDYTAEAPDAFAPFTVEEWATSPGSAYQDCIEWPVIPGDGPVLDPELPYPEVPTLILSGALDSITPIGEAQLVAAEMPDATLVQVGASTHVTALGDLFDCASVIAQRFVVDHEAGDTSCAGAIPPLPRVSAFPRTVADAVPATSLSDGASEADRRVVAVAVATVSDALARLRELYTTVGYGLRGGRYRSNGEGTRVALTDVRFTEDLAVSGSIDANDEDRLQEGSTVSVDVTLDDGTTAELSWTLGGLGDAVTVTGTVDGRDVEAQARYA
jgi:pimeloyl-ACP methyl ester carboxylesterase